jgi:predicted cupin superfamily sugar epimerase
VPQHAVPAGSWFGAQPAVGGHFALVGCTVAPGFDFADFELGDRAGLHAAFPQHAGWIDRLT